MELIVLIHNKSSERGQEAANVGHMAVDITVNGGQHQSLRENDLANKWDEVGASGGKLHYPRPISSCLSGGYPV